MTALDDCVRCGRIVPQGWDSETVKLHAPDCSFFQEWGHPNEPTRLELIAALTCAESILWMAEAYARPFPPELRTYRDAAETIRAVLARCTEGKNK